MAIGYLTIQARTAHDAVPLGGVQIRVLNRQGNSVYVLTTDENGETEQIPLETVDKSFSQNPYYAGTPYISYNVLAQMSGFNSLYVKSIPIYEGENALLPITLVPMQESQRSPLQAEISIGKPAVTEQGSRTQEGTVTEPESRILRQVVIPNPITVHLGTPTSSASNVQENYDIAVKIDNPGLAGARITSISVPVNGADNLYGSASAFLTSKLVVERIDGVRVNVPDICSVEATISNGILTATFDEPYTLTSEPIYVGYSIEVAELQTDTKAPIAVVAGDNPDGFWFHSTRTQLKWDNYVNKDKAGLQSAMSIMLDGNFDAATASISLPERTLMITNQENEYSFEVINGGVTEISNVGYSWKIGDISGEGTYEFPTPVRNAIGASGTVSFTVPAVEENGKNKISITLDKVNGSANPNLSASDEANVVFTPSVPVNRPLVEEYTGMWCGWCVRGYVALEHLREVYGEDFVAAAWHNTDPVAISSAYPNAVSGFPMAYINRSLSLDPGNLGIFWPEAAEALTDISIECDIEYTDNTKSAIKATATVTSIEDDNTPYYIGYLLIGDGLQDPSWLQSNYYSGRTAQAEAELAEPYAKMFAEMPSMAGGLTFNDVTLSKDYAMGVDGSLPQKGLKAFSPESHSITFDISDIRTTYIRPTNENPDANLIPIDKNKLRVIAFVLRTDGTVVNSCSSPYTDGSTHASGVETIVSDAEVARIVWHDLQGHTVSAPEKGRIYVCTHIMTDGTVRSSKVIVK